MPSTPVVLGVDLGCRSGWAVTRGSKVIHSCVIDLNRVRGAKRWNQFLVFAMETIHTYKPDEIAYEKVRRHKGTDAAHAYGAFEALLQMAATSVRELHPVEVSTVKRRAVGKGRASKEDMVAAARAIGIRPRTDDEADAVFIALAVSDPKSAAPKRKKKRKK